MIQWLTFSPPLVVALIPILVRECGVEVRITREISQSKPELHLLADLAEES